MHFHVITDVIHNLEKFLRMSALFTKKMKQWKPEKKSMLAAVTYTLQIPTYAFSPCAD